MAIASEDCLSGEIDESGKGPGKQALAGQLTPSVAALLY
jgi:hypothetical protein